MRLTGKGVFVAELSVGTNGFFRFAPDAQLIACYRISIDRQGVNGLCLEGQRAAVKAFAKANDSRIVAEFTEIESGRRHENRPQLTSALATVTPVDFLDGGPVVFNGTSEKRRTYSQANCDVCSGASGSNSAGSIALEDLLKLRRCGGPKQVSEVAAPLRTMKPKHVQTR